MWGFASHVAGSLGPRKNLLKPSQVIPDCSDDETSPYARREEVLECPICCESFNIVENVPYILWCGHTLCKNCILRIQWAVVMFPTLPIQLPLFISCPWCHCLSFRLVYRGQLKFPRKNFFLLWMIESMNSDNSKWHSAFVLDQSASNSSRCLSTGSSDHLQQHNIRRMHSDNSHSNSRQTNLNIGGISTSLLKLLLSIVNQTSKFPLVVICLFLVLYAIPASAAILVLYILVTLLFALPSLLILYFAYPGLDWLVREIIS
ncbi:hypothetical protein Cni_G19213 [Canna indica]|uniref:RING-type domain-containing protein n=1 Tax=Canna indica TaxID=4628 RepID=A0AAQ3KK79_9LILI|nr:hypothetical protein Cni_G19213 [Canna indica]